MTLLDIIEAICDTIKYRFPDHPIYIMQMPQGFKKPSFYVNIIGFTDRDLNLNGIKRNMAIEIVYFANQNKQNVVDAVQQLTAFQTLLNIFHGQCITVKDRCPKISKVYSEIRQNEVCLSLNLDYTFTPSKFDDSTTEYELMQNLITKYQEVN